MRKIALFCAPFLLLAIVPCQAEGAPSEKPPSSIETKIELIQGMRQDHLKWKVSGKHEGEHSKSKTDLHNVRVFLNGIKASISNGTYIGALDLCYGNIIHGRFRDRINGSREHSHEISHMRAKITGDYSFDAALKAGRSFHIFNDITFTPYAGYAFFFQHYNMKKARLTNRGEHPHYPGAPHFHDIHEKMHNKEIKCKTSWNAPFVDFRFSKPFFSTLKLDLGYTFFYPMQFINKTRFKDTRIKDKSRERNTFGQRADATLSWACTKHIELALGSSLSSFRGKGGSSRTEINGVSHKKNHFQSVRRTTMDYFLSLSLLF